MTKGNLFSYPVTTYTANTTITNAFLYFYSMFKRDTISPSYFHQEACRMVLNLSIIKCLHNNRKNADTQDHKQRKLLSLLVL